MRGEDELGDRLYPKGKKEKRLENIHILKENKGEVLLQPYPNPDPPLGD